MIKSVTIEQDRFPWMVNIRLVDRSVTQEVLDFEDSLVDWLNKEIGQGNWATEDSSGELRSGPMASPNYVIRVKTEEAAILLKMRF